MTAQPPVPVTGLWLRGAGGTDNPVVEVLVEFDGHWHLVGQESIDQLPLLASHIWEPSGIRRAPLDPTTEGT